MRLSLIVAMDQNRVIGLDNSLPWHLPADLKHFKTLTMGKAVIMGRRTYESIGRVLPGRRFIVLSRNAEWQAPGCEVYSDLQTCITALQNLDEAIIIGGANLYAQAMDSVDCLYVSHIEAQFEGDAWFPEIDLNRWKLSSETLCPSDEKNSHDVRFCVYQRNSS